MRVCAADDLCAHVATMPLKVLEQMSKHPLTDKGIAVFKADWAKAKGGK